MREEERIKRRAVVSLPTEIADRFTQPFGHFLRIEAASGIILLMATCAAVILSNSSMSAEFSLFWSTPVGLRVGSLELTRSLQHWINDGLMTLFFFVVSLELKRELVLGELRDLGAAALSLCGALGGMLVPAALYLGLMNNHAAVHGWGTVMATDTAFVIGCLAIFGARIPGALRIFLLSLAVFDDIGAILVVAVAYGEDLKWLPLALSALGFAVVAASARIGIRNVPLYFLIGGLIWVCFDASGIHPTIAGVILGLMTPTGSWVSDERLRAILKRVMSYEKGEHWSGDTADRRDLRRAGVAATEALSPLERLEMAFHPWVAFALMPLFAFANAGTEFHKSNFGHPVVISIFLALVIGKPLGVLTFVWLAERTGFATRTSDLSWPLLIAGSLLTGIGFTMSLFIAGLAYSPEVLDAAKTAILAASLVAAGSGVLILACLTNKSAHHRDLRERRARMLRDE